MHPVDCESIGIQVSNDTEFELQEMKVQYEDSQTLHQQTLENAIQKSDILRAKNQKLEAKLAKLSEKYKRYKIAYKKA